MPAKSSAHDEALDELFHRIFGNQALATINQTCTVLQKGRSGVYDDLAARRLDGFKVGRSLRISVPSIRPSLPHCHQPSSGRVTRSRLRSPSPRRRQNVAGAEPASAEAIDFARILPAARLTMIRPIDAPTMKSAANAAPEDEVKAIQAELRRVTGTPADGAELLRRQSLWRRHDDLVAARAGSAMTDDSGSTPVEPPHKPFEHQCEVCGKWGAFGYGVGLLRGKPGTWYCREHRPDVQASISVDEAPPATRGCRA